jgi:hypothetical protein
LQRRHAERLRRLRESRPASATCGPPRAREVSPGRAADELPTQARENSSARVLRKHTTGTGDRRGAEPNISAGRAAWQPRRTPGSLPTTPTPGSLGTTRSPDSLAVRRASDFPAATRTRRSPAPVPASKSLAVTRRTSGSLVTTRASESCAAAWTRAPDFFGICGDRARSARVAGRTPSRPPGKSHPWSIAAHSPSVAAHIPARREAQDQLRRGPPPLVEARHDMSTQPCP